MCFIGFGDLGCHFYDVKHSKNGNTITKTFKHWVICDILAIETLKTLSKSWLVEIETLNTLSKSWLVEVETLNTLSKIQHFLIETLKALSKVEYHFTKTSNKRVNNAILECHFSFSLFFMPKAHDLEFTTGSSGSSGSGGRDCGSDLPSTRAGGQDDGSYTNSLKWKSMDIQEFPIKSLKIYEEQWTCMKIIKIHKPAMKINENNWKYIKKQ